MTNPGMKCTRCRGLARFRFPSHNLKLCDACLDVFVERQAARAIKDFSMLEPGQKVLVAVSGGKDSLVLWNLLEKLGYETAGLHLDLDMGPFSQASLESCRIMAQRLGRELHRAELVRMTGHTMLDIVRANRRSFCSVCGSLKRYYLNRLTAELGYPAVATGHQLDDEAGRLLGNMIHNHTQYLETQWPVLPATSSGLVKKVKPLCRLAAGEVEAYALAHELPVAQGGCPNNKGATLTYYQEAMRFMDEKMPGTMSDFYFSFLKRKDAPRPEDTPSLPEMSACPVCGAPTRAEVCGTCRMMAKTVEWKNKWAERHAADAED